MVEKFLKFFSKNPKRKIALVEPQRFIGDETLADVGNKFTVEDWENATEGWQVYYLNFAEVAQELNFIRRSKKVKEILDDEDYEDYVIEISILKLRDEALGRLIIAMNKNLNSGKLIDRDGNQA